MIEMPRVVTPAKRAANYSNCPLKKRPIKYDPEEDSDSDISNKGCSPKPIDCGEPENLSTKPEDLRLTMKCVPEAEVVSEPPPLAIVAGRGEISSPSSSTSSVSSSSSYTNHYGSPYVSPSEPTYLPVPPPLKAMSNGPLEPISLNNGMWPRVSPFMPFNFPPSQNRTDYYGGISPSYPRPGATTQLSSHYAPFISRESGSPPHVSPPLKNEPCYPSMKYEDHHHHNHHHHQQQQQQRNRMLVSPSEIMTVVHHQPHPRMVEDLSLSHHHHSNNTQQRHQHPHPHPHPPPQTVKPIKKEPCCYSSPTHYNTSSSSTSSSSSSGVNRDSVITSSQSHNHSHTNNCSPPNSNNNNNNASSSHSPIAPTNVNGSVRYHCPDCNKSYSTFSGLSKHLQFHCASQNKKSFICKHCQKVYVSLGALKMHIRTHTLPCKCTLCGKAFSRPWLLQGHIRTHTGEKPFACQHCNRAFADRSNLRAHLQTHSEVKKYSCKTCSKTFSRMSLLVKHEDSGCMSSPLSN